MHKIRPIRVKHISINLIKSCVLLFYLTFLPFTYRTGNSYTLLLESSHFLHINMLFCSPQKRGYLSYQYGLFPYLLSCRSFLPVELTFTGCAFCVNSSEYPRRSALSAIFILVCLAQPIVPCSKPLRYPKHKNLPMIPVFDINLK